MAVAAQPAAVGAVAVVQAAGRRRTRKKPTIVAMARKLLVALWKYVTFGVVIEGAVMKKA